jgi:hypothetical protein
MSKEGHGMLGKLIGSLGINPDEMIKQAQAIQGNLEAINAAIAKIDVRDNQLITAFQNMAAYWKKTHEQSVANWAMLQCIHDRLPPLPGNEGADNSPETPTETAQHENHNALQPDELGNRRLATELGTIESAATGAVVTYIQPADRRPSIAS